MKRPITAAAALLLMLSLSTAAQADDDRRTLSGGLILNPEGIFTRYDHSRALGDTGLRLGQFFNNLVYSTEIGVQLQYMTDPAFFEIHLDLAAEPGIFRKITNNPATAAPPPRTPGVRGVARLQSNLNIKLRDVWLYNRLTGTFRTRSFREKDTAFEFELGRREWSYEEAVALFWRLGGAEGDGQARFWTYAEYTVGAIRDTGEFPNRVSAGLYTENWLRPGLLLNLDFFYSFAPNHRGPGLIFVYWVTWP